ncbi:unnamed protein product [Ceratitis capitata]|uniref:(Mediterranean fruit fly) hypothetical protein n=1 Tax=Ceratitis capitata TaxID=7213 RepID=A0A811UIX5_CERCA|nr:unnamed protein product [Ceratitis capitata]
MDDQIESDAETVTETSPPVNMLDRVIELFRNTSISEPSRRKHRRQQRRRRSPIAKNSLSKLNKSIKNMESDAEIITESAPRANMLERVLELFQNTTLSQQSRRKHGRHERRRRSPIAKDKRTRISKR